MQTFCKHQVYTKIDNIQSPKWSTDEVLISTARITDNTQHVLLQFTDESPKNKYGWFYLSGKVIRASKKQPNGRGEVYVVPMSKREEFEAITKCNHEF